MHFAGRIEPLANVDVTDLADWIAGIPLEDWPQQHRLPDSLLRPAMVNDPDWRGFAQARRYVVEQLSARLGGAFYSPMLSVVMPGASIPPHADRQEPDWFGRVHVPLVTNDDAWFVLEETRYNLKRGTAYLVNVEREHAIENAGATPRIHFMVDVR